MFEIPLTASVQTPQQPANRSAVARTDDITVHHRGNGNPGLGNDSWPLERLGAIDAIEIPMEEFRETVHRFIGPATEQKVPRLIGPGLLPQKGRQPSCCFGQEMAEMVEIQTRQKDDRRKLLLQRPNGIT